MGSIILAFPCSTGVPLIFSTREICHTEGPMWSSLAWTGAMLGWLSWPNRVLPHQNIAPTSRNIRKISRDIARYRKIRPFPMTGRNMAKLSTKRSTLTNSKSSNTKLEAPRVRHFACGTGYSDCSTHNDGDAVNKKLIPHDTTNQNRSTYRIGQHSIPKTSMVEVQHLAMHHPFDPPRVSTMGISLKMLHLDGQDD